MEIAAAESTSTKGRKSTLVLSLVHGAQAGWVFVGEGWTAEGLVLRCVTLYYLGKVFFIHVVECILGDGRGMRDSPRQEQISVREMFVEVFFMLKICTHFLVEAKSSPRSKESTRFNAVLFYTPQGINPIYQQPNTQIYFYTTRSANPGASSVSSLSRYLPSS